MYQACAVAWIGSAAAVRIIKWRQFMNRASISRENDAACVTRNVGWD